MSGSVDTFGQGNTSYHFDYGTSSTYGNSTPVTRVPAGGGPQSVTASISNLAVGTTYHYRLVALGPGGTAAGADATFTTTQTPPAELVANFQALPAGTVLTDQFRDLGRPNHGLLFNSTAPGLDANPPVVTDAGDGRHVAAISQRCTTAGGLQLLIPRDEITVDAGAFRTGAPGAVAVTLTAYDDHGAQLASNTVQVPRNGSFDHPVSVTGHGIAYARVTSPETACGTVGINDIRFKDITATIPPYFVLRWLGPQSLETHIQVKRGSSAGQETVVLKRFFGSKGPVTFAATRAPTGVSVSIEPAGATTADEVKLTVSATKDAALGSTSSITIAASGGPEAGSGDPISIPLNITDEFDVQLTGLEVTQGVQSLFSPIIVDPGTPGPYKFSYSAGDVPFPTGALLVSGAMTVVRMYPRLLSGPAEGVPGLSPTLSGFAQGSSTPLPGSPLSPVSAPATLSLTPFAGITERLGDNAFNFILPAAWTSAGEIRLVGNVNPPPPVPSGLLATAPTLAECADCSANNVYEVDHLGFLALPTVNINAYDMISGPDPATQDPNALYSVPLDDRNAVFDAALRLHAHGAPDQMYTSQGPVVDVTDLKYAKTMRALYPDNCPAYNSSPDYCDRAPSVAERDRAVLNRLEAADNGFGDIVAGMDNGVGAGVTEAGGGVAQQSPVFLVAEVNRQLTSVAHELGHALGRVHASPACGGGAGTQRGELWPPDGQGEGDGIGLDLNYGSGNLGAGNPFAVKPAFAAPWYDLMSYCPDGGAGAAPGLDIPRWQSVRGWNSEVAYLRAWASGNPIDYAGSSPIAGGSADRSARPSGVQPRRPAKPTAGIQVQAVVMNSNILVTSIGSHSARSVRAGAPSDFQLVLRGSGGHALASSTMLAATGHIDSPGHADPFTTLRGTLPLHLAHDARTAVAAATGIDIVRNGTVVASAPRTAHSPRVRLTAPRKGERVGLGRTVPIRWRASDADPLSSLEARLRYSTDNGRNWRTIFVGPNRNGVRLPSELLGASRDARLQLIISDGFNETVVDSARFTAAGRPPDVHIINSRSHTRVRADGALYMSGMALDDHSSPLRGRRLRWYVGRRLLGTGMELSRRLPAGRVILRLVATDQQGRSATARELVTVVPVTPRFTALQAPRHLSRKARRLVLQVASTVPATLTISGHHYAVDERLTRVSLPIKPGRRALRPSLELSDHGYSTRLVLLFRRR